MTSTIKQLYQEFKEINKKSVYDNQAQLDFPKGEENPFEIFIHCFHVSQVTLTPQYGFFKSGKISFLINLPKNYPDDKPTITCTTKIYHPNISFSGNICFSMLSSDWSKDYRLEHYINGLLFLLANPNHDSPLNSTCVDRAKGDYELNVQMSLSGFPVKGVSFPKSTATDEICLSEPTMLRYIYRGAFTTANNQMAQLADIYKNYAESVVQTAAMSFLKEHNIQGYVKKWKDTNMTVHKVKSRAKCMGFDTKFVLKELLWKIDNKIVLVVSNGLDLIDETALATQLNCKKCELVQPDEILEITGWAKHSLPIFGTKKVDEIIINSTIFELNDSDELAMASGCTGMLMCMKKSEFETMTNHLKFAKRMKLPTKVEDGVSPLVEKVEKMTVQPN